MACEDCRSIMLRLARVAGGFGLLACGVALLVLPGPGILVILAALAVLATEFAWARGVLARVKRIGGGRRHAKRSV